MGSTASPGCAIENGNNAAADTLFDALYSELHGLARRELARRGRPAALSVTTLLHEAYLDMAERDGTAFPDQLRFMGYAARVMRGIIIDRARRCNSLKRGGAFELQSIEEDRFESPSDAMHISRIGYALEQLEEADPELAKLVDLKFFCGFSFAEIAVMQSLSERSVQRRWEKARIYLYSSMGEGLSH
jgi:RNA polymerase sigma factor (TIGR02999 family)